MDERCLESRLADIARRFSLPAPLSLPEHRAKGASRTDRRHYRDLIGPEEREWIEIVCAREIRLLDYRF